MIFLWPFQSSWVDVACGRISGGTASSETTAALIKDFDIYEYLEDRQLPALHKLVLGLAQADLEAQLQSSTRVQINALTSGSIQRSS